MSINETKGICRFCFKSFSGRSMGRHLETCSAKIKEDSKSDTNKKKKELIYQIKISGYKIYWLQIEMKGTKKLSDLDDFLRKVWCECCGHLSEFTIGVERYSYILPDKHDIFSDWFDSPQKSMNFHLKDVLGEKSTFKYEYDFGSTTKLVGLVVAIRKGYLKESVKILARNNPFEFNCEKCNKPASVFCTDCGYFYCDHCFPKHGCGDDMGLPVVNSPRMGECGYSGEYDFDNFTAPSEHIC